MIRSLRIGRRQASDAGFTLIEVLIAVTIAVSLTGVAVTGFMSTRKAARLQQSITDLTLEAAFLYRRLERDLTMCLPGAAMRLESIPSPNADDPGNPLTGYRFCFFGERSDRMPGGGIDSVASVTAALRPHAGAWFGWEWRPASSLAERNRGVLKLGFSSNALRPKLVNLPTSPSSAAKVDYFFFNSLEFRRSAQRDLNDNDGRFLPGIADATAANGSPIILNGDYTDLFGEDANGNSQLDAGEDVNGSGGLDELGAVSRISAHVASFELQWVDHQGHVTTAPALGSPAAAADGLYRDGRNLSVLRNRPSIIRVHLTLTDPATSISRSFSFSFPIGLETSKDAGL
jgi:prepilin-type N-terminal cleavage/methylation domain-containing protein